ncbi:MAG: 2-amino-4-hydroxy-6-hydroxymethyldihydropteridine diphosphokinase [Chthoniobacterales bacterium]
MPEVGIGMGANLGDRKAQIEAAAERLRLLAKTDTKTSYPFRISEILESQPINCPEGSPPFLNAVSVFDTTLSPLSLLDALQTIETDFGRPKNRLKNAPRNIDLDLLYYDNLTLSSQRLDLPHPRIFERFFVLLPLSQVDPKRILPEQNITVLELYKQFTNNK